MTPQDQFNSVIEPVIEQCRHRGFAVELMRQLALLGHPVKPQAFYRWIHPDRRKRIQPAFGTGLMILQAATMAEREWSRKRGVSGIEAPRQNAVQGKPRP